jgi:autotransporter-associated beta strand protein
VLAIATVASHTGGTVINDGELRIRTTANRLPIAGAVTVNGPGVFNLNNVNQQIGSLSGNGSVGTGGATLTINGSTSTTFDGALKNIANSGAGGVTTGNGRLTKDGTGVLTLTNSGNDLRGRITLINGGIIVAPGAKLSDAIADLFVDGGTLTLNNAAQTVENLTSTVSGTSTGVVVLGTGHTLTTDPVASTTFAAKITGAGSLVKANVLSGATNRTLTLTGANDYDGNTTISGGNIAVGSPTALGSTIGHTEVAAGAEVLFTGATTNFTVNEPLRIAGAGNTDGGAISVIASATPTISGPVTLTGDTTITVSSTAGATFNNANAITSASNQNLTLKGGSGVGAGGTVSGTIDLGTGSLTKNEGGSWALSAPGGNTYSGGTIINGGTVYANNTTGSATGSGGVAVNSGGTLGGTGAVANTVSVNTGGTLAPGTSIESLATGDLTFNGGSNFDVEVDSSAVLPDAADLMDVTGSLTIALDGTANLNLSDIAATDLPFAVGTKFTLVRYDQGTWNGGTFASKPDDSVVTVGVSAFVINYNDTLPGVNFGGGSGTLLNSSYLTLTAAAVPEASAFLFGGLVCCAAGVRRYVRRRRAGAEVTAAA